MSLAIPLSKAPKAKRIPKKSLKKEMQEMKKDLCDIKDLEQPQELVRQEAQHEEELPSKSELISSEEEQQEEQQEIKKEKKSRSKIGTKEQVWNGEKEKTRGGLKKEDLCLNKRGKIVSKKMQAKGLAQAKKFGFKKK